MIPQPVKRYREPVYPTRLAVVDDPGLLLRHVPGSWRRNAVVMGALSALLATQSCTTGDAGGGKPMPTAAVVAPVFEHGDGQGSTGCVVVAPPAFLSEEEALAVIRRELRKAGLRVTGQNVLLEGVVFYPRFAFDLEDKTEIYLDRRQPLTLAADLADASHGVAIEYVARDDYYPLGGLRSGGTASDYDFPEVANRVAASLREKGPGMHFGVFYDPCIAYGRIGGIDWGDDDDDDAVEEQYITERQARAAAKRLLRLQVRDFIDWLKGQGAI